MAIKMPAPNRPALDLAGIFRGSAIAAAVALAGSFILGMVYHFSGLAESTLPLITSIILLAGVFSGGYAAARRAGTKGLFHGLGVGAVIFILIWILMGLFLPAGVSLIPLAQKFLICLVGGALGGIAGIIL
ncbi:MAG: TIGR04086 family membrane protein [Peptococcaceae bacterium]|nr:TIGR04086 family membrane protein [Peptococcaceae bacterium]